MNMKSQNKLMRFFLSYREILYIAIPMDTWRRVDDVNLPDDVKLLSVHLNKTTQQFEFLISSETFKRVPPGGIIPELKLSIQLKEFTEKEPGKPVPFPEEE